MSRRIASIGLLVLVSILAASFMSNCSPTGAPSAGERETVGSVANPCDSTPTKLDSLTPQVPSDFAPSQTAADCFGWQMFIALNWAASPTACGQPDMAIPAAQFGTPNGSRPVVWESYKVDAEVFVPNAEPPTPWCAPQGVPDHLAPAVAANNLAPTSQFGHKVLTQTTKFGANQSPDSLDPTRALTFTEAFTNSWLTAQNGNLTMYEIRMNETEFTYITTTQTYDADRQLAVAQSADGLSLPNGSIEVKAAWVELDDPSLWPYFKTSQALVSYPWDPQKVVTATMGLVGLHIIQKTPDGQQFIWATFEHVNNAPSTADISGQNLLDWYTYYNKQCNTATDHYQCQPNRPPQPGVDPYQAPVQVVRETPLDTSSINQYVWGLIGASNPQSVYLNYQLVNVLWPNANTSVPAGACAGSGMPMGDPRPSKSMRIVANTTLETYFQKQYMCLDCHRQASIAPSNSCSSGSGYASDYSFLFGEAQSGTGGN